MHYNTETRIFAQTIIIALKSFKVTIITLWTYCTYLIDLLLYRMYMTFALVVWFYFIYV